MIRIKNLTLKNFLSVGNVTQAVNFDRSDLTLVLGANIDLGGDDAGAKNGTGKTTCLNALSYGLFGQSLSSIKKDNLINRTNAKGMLVTVDFEKDGRTFRIERGRKPNVLKFYEDGAEKESKDDNSQGDSRETQAEIERLLRMSHDMFTHIIALNTYTDPFLKLKANEQRVIIEQLLGITLLSEKAESLKELVRQTKDSISQEEFRIKAVSDANKRIQEQIESLKRRQRLWTEKHTSDLAELTSSLSALQELDIDAELIAHSSLAEWMQLSKDVRDLTTEQTRAQSDIKREEKQIVKLSQEIELLLDHKCHSCGQEIHDDKHNELLSVKEKQLQTHAADLNDLQELNVQIELALKSLGELGKKPVTFYDKEQDAFEHRNKINTLQHNIEQKSGETNPYSEQIHDMETQALEEVNFDTINHLNHVKEHQEFLLKLLTSKDSFIRKKIIDQNLTYLNVRLSHYLDAIGLPHNVVFQNDLSVNITELGRELDFDNLSRGERTRLILSLSWAFRDVWENLYEPVNVMFVDELIDNGLDSNGVDNSLSILKKMSREQNKSVWLVSHREELPNRVNNILTVVKENGFTTYNYD